MRANLHNLTKVHPMTNASALPPLRNSPGNSRTLNLELQKTRTAVMDSIQAENNSRARGNQQFESAILLAEHEFTPKIRTLNRQSVFTRKQLTDLIAHITETQGSIIQNIKNSYESSKLQLEQQIKQDSVSKLNPIVEDQHMQASKIQKLTENIVAFLSKNADSIREVQTNYDQIDRDVTDFNKKSLSTVNEIQPRISIQESKVAYLENQTEEFMKIISNIQDMKNTEKQLRDTLKKIEDEDLDLAISQAAQETLSLISTKTTEIDQRIFETETISTSLQGSLESGKQSQDHQDTQVEEMSRKSMELESLLKTDEDELISKLDALQEQLTKVKSKIMDQIKEQNESTVDGMKFSEEDFEDNVQRLSVLSSKDITQLAEDWNKFSQNNKIAQETADKIIYDAMDKLQGQGNIMKRLSYQESRLKWCLQRLEYWERDDAKKRRAGFESGQQMAKKLEELEQKLCDFEDGLESADGQKAEIEKIEKTEKSVPIPGLYGLADTNSELEELKIDPNLVLTYPADEPPFEPLKRTKEDEEIANKRLERLKQEKEKRFAIKIDDSKIVDDFVDSNSKEPSQRNPEENNQNGEEQKIKERSLKKKKKSQPIEEEDTEEETENEEEEKKPKMSLKGVIADELKKEEEEENEEEENEEEEKPTISLKGAITNELKKEEEEDQKEDDGNMIKDVLMKPKLKKSGTTEQIETKDEQKKRKKGHRKVKRIKSTENVNDDE